MPKVIPAIAAALALARAQPAQAHDRWANGDPVPAYVRQACCGVSDAHHLRPEPVQVVQGGYTIDGYKGFVPESKMEPSPDGEYWGFWAELPNGNQSAIFCLFGPMRGA